MPAVCVNIPLPPTVKVLALPILRLPAFEKLPDVVKVRPPWRLKAPVDAVAAKLAKPLALLVELRTLDAVPVKVMLAALLTMLAPGN
jgi:hypothetical protein